MKNTVVIALAALLLPRFLESADCNQNGVDDLTDIGTGVSADCNLNAVPDECDLAPGTFHLEIGQELRCGDYLSSAGAVVDLDGDSDLDLAAGCWRQGDDALVVFLNRGGGIFSEAGRYPAAPPRLMTAADLDADGDLDILTASSSAASESEVPGIVSVHLNDGQGTFRESLAVAAAHAPRSLTLADLDGLSGPDVVVCDLAADTVLVLLNAGDGKLAEPMSYGVGPRPRTVAAADLNADGAVDLAVANQGHPRNSDSATPESAVSVLFNRGGGEFAPAVSLAIGETSLQVEAADADGDGDLDLVSLNAVADQVMVFRNQGGGSFAPAQSFAAGGTPDHLLLADLDGDGDLDLATAGFESVPDTAGVFLGEIAILLNSGDGSFAQATVFSSGDNCPRDIAAGDLDGDGDLDLVTANGYSNYSDTVSVLRNSGAGRFSPPADFATDLHGWASPSFVETADLDGDGDLDVAATNQYGSLITLFNRSAEEGIRIGCNEFLRGDLNTDGIVSISDVISLYRFLFLGGDTIACADAADVVDDDRLDICDVLALKDGLFESPDWALVPPEPFPGTGQDPTPAAIPGSAHGCGGSYSEDETYRRPFGCNTYEVEPPRHTDDVVTLGEVSAAPGQEVRIPIHLICSEAVDGIQLVLEYDTNLIEIASDQSQSAALSFEGTVLDGTDSHGRVTVHPSAGVVTIALVTSLIAEGFEIPAREEVLLAWLHAKVSPEALPGTVISLAPPSGEGEAGVGPYHLRNELSYRGGGRFISIRPRLDEAYVSIVGDQSFFRGDSNGDTRVDISDSIHILGWLFLGGEDPDCEDAADSNDDGELNVTDAIFALNFLFNSGATIPPPYLEEGRDPTDDDPLHCYRLRSSEN